MYLLLVGNIVEYPQNVMFKIIFIFLGIVQFHVPGTVLSFVFASSQKRSALLYHFFTTSPNNICFRRFVFQHWLSSFLGVRVHLVPEANPSGGNYWLWTFRSGNAGMGTERCHPWRVYWGEEDPCFGDFLNGAYIHGTRIYIYIYIISILIYNIQFEYLS